MRAQHFKNTMLSLHFPQCEALAVRLSVLFISFSAALAKPRVNKLMALGHTIIWKYRSAVLARSSTRVIIASIYLYTRTATDHSSTRRSKFVQATKHSQVQVPVSSRGPDTHIFPPNQRKSDCIQVPPRLLPPNRSLGSNTF